MRKLQNHSKKLLALLCVLTLVLTLVFTMSVSAGDTNETTTPTNLLSSAQMEAGTQSVERYNVAHTFSWDNVWPDDYGYGTAAYSQYIPTGYGKLLADGSANNDLNAYPNYEVGAGTATTQAGWDATAARRLALLFDLGDVYNLDQVTLEIPTKEVTNKRFVFDCAVYAADTKAGATALDSEACVGHYAHASGESKITVDLTDAKGVQYVMVVFNKLGSDPGNLGCSGNTAYSPSIGRYGQNAPTGCYYINGGLYITEVEIFGEKPTNLLSESTVFSTCSIAHPDKQIWDDQYNYGAVTNTWYSTTFFPKNLCDGDQTTLAYDNQGFANVWSSPFGADRRLAFFMDLGKPYALEDINIHVSEMQHTVYDFTVYGSTTVNTAANLLSDTHKLGHYTSRTQGVNSAYTFDANRVAQYVLIVFNKLGSDAGNSSVATGDAAYVEAGTYGTDPLPGWSTPRGGLYVTEIEIFGIEAEAELNAPVTSGSTISVASTNELQFKSCLPASLPAFDYTVVEYGTLVIPNQYLPGGGNVKDGAVLEYGNAYVAAAKYEVAEGETVVPGTEFTAELIGSAQGVYPGVKFAARSYVIYEKDGAQTIVYGETVVRSVYGTARTIATAILNADTLSATVNYPGKIQANTAVADVEAAKSTGTTISLLDVYAFVCANYDAVAELAPAQ